MGSARAACLAPRLPLRAREGLEAGAPGAPGSNTANFGKNGHFDDNKQVEHASKPGGGSERALCKAIIAAKGQLAARRQGQEPLASCSQRAGARPPLPLPARLVIKRAAAARGAAREHPRAA